MAASTLDVDIDFIKTCPSNVLTAPNSEIWCLSVYCVGV